MSRRPILINDHFQNFKRHNIPKAQLIIADIPYNVGINAYGSSPEWYVDGDNKNGESDKAGKAFFDTDNDFRVHEYMHFCSRLLKPEPKEKGEAGAMIVFCSYQQLPMLAEAGIKYGFPNSYPLIFIKSSSSQVLKANMKIVGATEYALVLYRGRLPKFRNDNRMQLNWIKWQTDRLPKIHPTQKPLPILKHLIGLFTDPGDVVIDPVAGSGTTLRAAYEMGRRAFGFEIKKDFAARAQREILDTADVDLFTAAATPLPRIQPELEVAA